MSDGEKLSVKSLLRFKDELRGESLVIDMYESLAFKGDNPEEQFNDALIGYQVSGNLEAIACCRYEKMEVDTKAYYAQMDEYCREMDVIDKPTDSRVKAYIQRDEKYIKRKKAVAKAKERWTMLRHYNQAFRMKIDLLRTKAANMRAEVGLSTPDTSRPGVDEED